MDKPSRRTFLGALGLGILAPAALGNISTPGAPSLDEEVDDPWDEMEDDEGSSESYSGSFYYGCEYDSEGNLW